jgi:prepilin-type N-terminal cleavage/methylation domain-containing protein
MDVVQRPPNASSQRGYSLLETLVALFVFGLALLVAASAITAQAGLTRRLQVRQQLLQTAEAVLESLRGGVLPLESGRVDLGSEFRGSSREGSHSSVTVIGLEPDGLYDIEVQTWIRIDGRRQAVVLESLLWRP